MKKRTLCMMICAAALCVGCGPKETGMETTQAAAERTEAETTVASSESAAKETEKTDTESTEAETEHAAEENALKEIAALLNMQDADTAELFGGGEENWTEDHSFFIGRIFQAEIEGTIYPVYTTCSQEGQVESVSIQIVSGSPVEDALIQEWTDRITEASDAEAVSDGSVSEGGSRKTTWTKDGKRVTMYCMADNLSIAIQNQVGELK